MEAAGELCYLYMDRSNGRSKISITQTIGECEKRLRLFGFLRIHRQYLLNLSFFKQASAGMQIELVGGQALPIARRRRAEVAKVLAFYGL